VKILALDLGSKTGYALEANDYPLACGTLELSKKTISRTGDARVWSLYSWIIDLHTVIGIDLLVWEDVQFQSAGCAQTQLWASLRTACWFASARSAESCGPEVMGMELDCCPVQTLKKWATGSGGAKKDDMARHLCKNPRFQLVERILKAGKNKGKPAPLQVRDTVTRAILDDNAVDALHLLGWAKEKYATSKSR